jgi:hypothetical protein
MQEALERIAAALEQQVANHDEDKREFLERRDADLARHARHRADDLKRITAESAEYRAQIDSLLVEFKAAMDEVKRMMHRVAAIEQAQAADRGRSPCVNHHGLPTRASKAFSVLRYDRCLIR